MILETRRSRCVLGGSADFAAGREHKLVGVLFVTWNVNSLRARLPRVLELLDVHQPEVVALQETKCTPANFPASFNCLSMRSIL